MNSKRLKQIVPAWLELGLLSIAAAWIWGICLDELGTKLVVVALSLATLYLGMHARILVHELGHLIAARAVGLHQRKLQLGAGPLIWSRLFPSGLLFEWRMFARGGWVLALPSSEKNLRIRQLLFVSAGPLIDVFLICSLSVALTTLCGSLTAAFTDGVPGIIMFLLFWWTAISAVSGLIPHRVNIGGRRLWTDGYWILLLCTHSKPRIKEVILGFDSEKALEFLRSGPKWVPARDRKRCHSREASEPLSEFYKYRTRLEASLRPNSTA